jgi:hypothetical protein
VAASALSLAAHAEGAAIECGVPIEGQNVSLKKDLSCPGDGIVAGDSRQRISLNGHTITSTEDPRRGGSSVGIDLNGHTASIFGGGATIEDFQTGIVMDGQSGFVGTLTVEFPAGNGLQVPGGRFGGLVSRVKISNAGANGVAIAGADGSKGPIPKVTLSSVTVFSSALDGMSIDQGSITTIENSASKQNGGDGIEIVPQPNGGKISIADSKANYNVGWGIKGLRRVKSSGNTAVGNGEVRQCFIVECN